MNANLMIFALKNRAKTRKGLNLLLYLFCIFAENVMGMRTIKTVLLSLSICFVCYNIGYGQVKYEAVIKNLNTKKLVILEQGEHYFFDHTGEKKVQKGQLEAVDEGRIKLGGNWINTSEIHGLSKKKYHRRKTITKVCEASCYLGGTILFGGLVLSGAFADWDSLGQSYAGRAAVFSLPLLVPCGAFLLLHKGPQYDCKTACLLECRKKEENQ